MSKLHKKKRNTGLLYEFLIKTISNAIVEGDEKKSNVALKIIKKYYKPNTELYKEFRLLNAMVNTTVSSEGVAMSILSEAKSACRTHNLDKLNKEKSILIKEINYSLNSDGCFYDAVIPNYRMYATCQTLLEGWRQPGSLDLSDQAKFEDALMKCLMQEKLEVDNQFLSEPSSGENRLLIKLMMKKINENYHGSFNEKQRQLIKTYVYNSETNLDAIKEKLEEVKRDLTESIDEYCNSYSNEKYIIEKLNEIKLDIANEVISEINDQVISKFMLYINLVDEIKSPE